MKTLTTVFGISTIIISGTIAPLSALAQSPKVEPDLKAEQPLLGNPVPLSKKMAIYSECVDAHAKLNGTDFKQVNKFCSCVVDQSIQGDNSGFGTCASGSGGGGAMGIIGEVAPSVITGVMEGINNRSSKGGGSGLLGGGLIDSLGGLLGGGSSGGFNIKDILKNRF